MRRIILIALGVLILVAAFFWARSIANVEKKIEEAPEKILKTVFVDTVQNTKIPIIVPATGTLMAKNRLEIYAEVEGLFLNSSRDFKPGQQYNRGELLLQINSSEYEASVQSARSNLYNLITAMMPDLRLDYPESFQKWQRYLSDFDIKKTTPPLPEARNEQEKYFITGRNITTTYFDIKNREERLTKFNIRAPFAGILTEALVTKGSLIRPGQKLGEFINPEVFEMEVAVPKNFIDFLETGKTVQLSSIDKTKEYQGMISRINARIDQNTQTVKVFVTVKGENIREGMFLEARLEAREENNAYQIARKLIVNESQIYFVNDDKLQLLDVELVYSTDKEVVVKGIPDNTVILREVLPGAFEGQPVIINDSSNQITN
ncbi:HlyD family efflux transporter periplasmic adaptor subunit [uncultured Planktosalinus sp.]|uniref:efflux RND transporter periplasmic adaptor subunit n=1 Tax=uncultured Planktosalinus sp. TaxID=1810935 RepID=UPI0030DDD5AC